MNKLLAAATTLLACAGCLGAPTTHYSPAPKYTPVTTPAAQPTPAPAPTEALPLGCSSLEVAPTGTLAKDLVGVWQDWGASADGTGEDAGTDRLITFSSDGKVTVASFPLDANGLPDELRPATVDFSGTYEVLATGQLKFVWDDGLTETSSTALSVENIPGCTMLVIAPGSSARIPSAGQLERVVCVLPAADGSGLVR